MPRARSIKHSFFTNDQLAEIPALGRLLFIGLWTLADREGRVDDRTRRLKAEILPYDDCDVDSLLNDLQERGFIVRYESSIGKHIQIVNFEKHQHPHPKEPESQIPAMESLTANQGAAVEKQGEAVERNGKSRQRREEQAAGTSFPSFPSFPSAKEKGGSINPARERAKEPPPLSFDVGRRARSPATQTPATEQAGDCDRVIGVIAQLMRLAIPGNEAKYNRAAIAVLNRVPPDLAEAKIREFLQAKPKTKLNFFDEEFASWMAGLESSDRSDDLVKDPVYGHVGHRKVCL